MVLNWCYNGKRRNMKLLGRCVARPPIVSSLSRGGRERTGTCLASDNISLTIELTTPACPLKDQIRSDVWARSREGTRGRLHDGLTAQVQGPPDVSANLATAGLEKAIRRTFILELNWYHMRAARLQGAAGPSGSS